MNEKELLKLVAPMWKQYLRCIVGCFCAFLTFNLTSKFLVFFFMIMTVISFRSMVEVTLWQRKICKDDYEVVTCKIGGILFPFTMVYCGEEPGIGFDYVGGLKSGDIVKAIKVVEDYLIIEKVDK